MGKFKELRDTLMADLAPVGVPVTDGWKLASEPPCILLTPPISGAYIGEAKEFGTVVFNIDVVVLVKSRPPETARDELEELLEAVLRNTADWALLDVDPPGVSLLADSTIEFLGTVVHLGKSVYL